MTDVSGLLSVVNFSKKRVSSWLYITVAAAM